MNILSLESSAKAASVAVMQGNNVIGQYFQNSGLTHSRTILAMCENLLRNLEMSMADIDGIAVAYGPGSFTGIRIGLAAAKGLSWGSGIPICGVSTLEAMAYQFQQENVTICPVMDARRSQIYNAKFEFYDGKLIRKCEDRAISIQQLSSEAKNDKMPYFLLGDGAELCYNYLVGVGIPAVLLPENIRWQSAWGVCLAAKCADFVSPDNVVPHYLRLSQAERERIARITAENEKNKFQYLQEDISNGRPSRT